MRAVLRELMTQCKHEITRNTARNLIFQTINLPEHGDNERNVSYMHLKTKQKKWIILFFMLFSLFFILPMAITIFLYNKTFGVREAFSDNDYAYLNISHPDFKRTPARFLSNKSQELQGYFYAYEETPYQGLIVLAHGIGGGHDSYLVETEYLARAGYLVFTYDNTGTNESEGKNLIGLSQSAIDLHHALTFVEGIPALQDLPLLLYGHSWGGFAVATVNNYPHNVKGIVSVAGFAENNNVLKQEGRKMVGNAIEIFMPYLGLYEQFLFGAAADDTGISGLAQTDAQVLLLHSTDDDVVDYEENFGRYLDAFGDDPRFTFYPLTNHGHAATLTPEGNQKFIALRDQMKEIEDKESAIYLALQKEKNQNKFNLDPEVMKTITDFYDTVVSHEKQ